MQYTFTCNSNRTECKCTGGSFKVTNDLFGKWLLSHHTHVPTEEGGGGGGLEVWGPNTVPSHCMFVVLCLNVLACTHNGRQVFGLSFRGAVDQRIKQGHAAWKLLHTGLHFVLTLIPYSTYDTECIEFQKFSVKYLKQMFPTQYYL